MSHQTETVTSTEQPRFRVRQKKTIVTLIITLLVYSATVQRVFSAPLEAIARQRHQDGQIGDLTFLLVFMRLGVIVWVVLSSFFQGLCLRLLYRGIVRGDSFSLSTSWCWVLLGQAPFVIVSVGLLLLGDSDDLGFLGTPASRLMFGAFGALIYCALAHRILRSNIPRLSIFFVVVTIINSVLLVAVSS